MERVARFVDTSISETQHHQRVLMIQQALSGGTPILVAPGRRLLKEGVLYKVREEGRPFTDVWQCTLTS